MTTTVMPTSHAPMGALHSAALQGAAMACDAGSVRARRSLRARLITRGAALVALLASAGISSVAHASAGVLGTGSEGGTMTISNAVTSAVATIVSLVTLCIRDGAQWILGMVDALLGSLSISLMAEVPAATPADAFIARAPDLAVLALIAAVAFAFMRSRQIGEARRLEVAARMIEKGIEPPANLIGQDDHADLRRGVVLTSLGLGLVLAAWMTGKAEASPLGLIPGFIGLGYLVSHRLTRADRGRG